MSRETKTERMSRLHQHFLLEFNKVEGALRDERIQNLEDRRFCHIAGAQWEGALQQQFVNKPRLEVNKVQMAANRVITEMRANRIDTKFRPSDGAKDDQIVDTLSSLLRADEYDSNAQEAYDNAYEEAVVGGIGAWRLTHDYEDEYSEEDDNQRIRFEPIYDADQCVYFDLNSKRSDHADATICYVTYPVPYDRFVDEYPEANPADWPQSTTLRMFDWANQDLNKVRLCDVYHKEEVAVAYSWWRHIDGSEERYLVSDLEANDSTLEKLLVNKGARELRRKKVKTTKIHKYVMSGGCIVEDCGYIAGKHIPVVLTHGKRAIIDGTERAYGLVRPAKDAQRLKNMQVSKLAEVSSLSSVAKPIVTPQQIAGHEYYWQIDNIENQAYLPLNPIVQPDGSVQQQQLQYTQPAPVPPALAALLQVTEMDMQDILGQNKTGADELKAGVSGKAVELVQQRVDAGAHIYMSNFSKALKRSGEVWLSMAQDLYTEKGRKMKTISPDGSSGQVELHRPVILEDGTQGEENALADRKWDVYVDVGPSSTSRRESIVRNITSILGFTEDPITKAVLTSVAISNLDGEGFGDVREYFRKQLVAQGVLKPTEQDLLAAQEAAANQQQTPPNPNEVLALKMAEESEAKAAKARADTIAKLADAKKIEAETLKVQAETQNLELDTIMRIGSD